MRTLRSFFRNPWLFVDIFLLSGVFFAAGALGVKWAHSRLSYKSPTESTLPKPGEKLDIGGIVSEVSEVSGVCEVRLPVLLVFWTPRCGYCKKELPLVVPELADKVNILSLVPYRDKEEASEPVSKFLAEQNLRMNVCMDGTGKVFTRLGVSGTPSYVLVNPAGRVVYSRAGTGILEDPAFRKALDVARGRRTESQDRHKQERR